MAPPFFSLSRIATRLVRRAASGAALAALSCAASPEHPATPESIAAEVASRDETAVLEEALALLPEAARDPLVTDSPHREDPTHPDYWRARALAFRPEVRAAHCAWFAARARAPGAGAPGPVGLGYGNRDFAGDQRENEVLATFDLLGLLGVGPAAAARKLADAAARDALAELEAAAWSARFAADRALVRHAAAQARQQALEQIVADAAGDRRRIETYEERGWVPAAELYAASGALDSLELALAAERVAAAAARRELAVTSGLPPDAPAFAALSPVLLDVLQPAAAPVVAPEPAALLDRVPRLRELRLELAVAEARLRRAVAERWPTLRVGPQWRFIPGDVLPGGLVSVEVPFPGSTEPEIRAARVERDRAVEAVEEGLLETLAALEEARTRCAEARHNLEDAALHLRAAAASSWNASRAAFGVDARALMGWSQALSMVMQAELGWVRAQEELALAALDGRELSGQLDGREASP